VSNPSYSLRHEFLGAPPLAYDGYTLCGFELSASYDATHLSSVGKFLGAELGGPKPAAYATGVFFVGLWLTYVTFSILDTTGNSLF